MQGFEYAVETKGENGEWSAETAKYDSIKELLEYIQQNPPLLLNLEADRYRIAKTPVEQEKEVIE